MAIIAQIVGLCVIISFVVFGVKAVFDKVTKESKNDE